MDKEDLKEMLIGGLYTFVLGLIFMTIFLANNFQTFKCVLVSIPYIKDCEDLD